MDTRTVQRQVNKAKAAVEERRGPAGHSQSEALFLDALRHFHEEDPVSLAIPAHKSGVGASPDMLETLGEKAVDSAQTLLSGIVTRHPPWQVQEDAQQLAAEAL